MTMCTCDQNNPVTEEYYTAFSDFETSTPQEWRTSTRYYEGAEGAPEYVPSTSRGIPRRHFRRTAPRDSPLRSIPRRPDLVAGVAIVPRRIDFDTEMDDEDLEEEGDLGLLAAETLQRLREAAQRPTYERAAAAPGTYRLRRSRPTQHPLRQYAPRMTRITPCGKCLRI